MTLKGPKIYFLLYSLLIAVLFLLLKGYQFNTDDQAEHLPQVYKLIQPGLYPHDLFVAAASSVFTIRTYYIYLIYGLSFLAPVSAICFILTLACLTATCLGFMKITERLADNRLAPYLAPLLIFFVFFNFPAGGNRIQYTMLICSSLAKAISVFGIYCFMLRRNGLSAFLIGIASLFQVLVGLQLFIILGIVLLARKEPFRKQLWFVLIYLVSASAMLFPILYRQLFPAVSYDHSLYYRILYTFRNPLHYLPSLFPLRELLKFSLLALSGLLLAFTGRSDGHKFFRVFFLAAIAGMFLYTILLEGFGIMVVGKIQWFKTAVWLCSFAGILIAAGLTEYLHMGLNPTTEQGAARISVVLIPLLLGVLLFSRFIPIPSLQGKYMACLYQKSDLSRLHEWIEKNTPTDAVFLVPPDDVSFLCEAKRSSLISYKPVIHEPFFLLPWYQRFREVYGVSADTPGTGKVLEKASVSYNRLPYSGTNFIVNYRIDTIKNCNFTSCLKAVVHREGDYILTVY